MCGLFEELLCLTNGRAENWHNVATEILCRI